jgi:hypothetical protein
VAVLRKRVTKAIWVGFLVLVVQSASLAQSYPPTGPASSQGDEATKKLSEEVTKHAREEADKGALGAWGLLVKFTEWLWRYDWRLALLLRCVLLPAIGFVIGLISYNKRLGVVLAVALIAYEPTLTVAVWALILILVLGFSIAILYVVFVPIIWFFYRVIPWITGR